MERMFPNGTVVTLKGATHKVMICGRMQGDEEGNAYDYCGCPYPEGYLGGDQMVLFNRDAIELIHFLGLQDEEEFQMLAAIEEATA